MTPFLALLLAALASPAAGNRVRLELEAGLALKGRFRMLRLLHSERDGPGRALGEFPYGRSEASPLSTEAFAAPEELGRGAFGDTWHAVDLKHDRLVAVKIFYQRDLKQDTYVTKADMAKDARLAKAVSESERECRLVQEMQKEEGARPEGKASLCGCYESHVSDMAAEDDVAFLVLELCGTDLDKRMRQQIEAPVDAEEWREGVRRWMRGALQGISFMSGLTPPRMHLDLKLNNVVANDAGDAKLIDFGFTVSAEDFDATRITRRFAPPEYFEQESRLRYPAEKAWAYDIWGLGTAYYNLLCSEPAGNMMNMALDMFVAGLEGKSLPAVAACKDGGAGYGEAEDWALVAGALAPLADRLSPEDLLAKLPKPKEPPCAAVEERKTGAKCRVFKCQKSRNAECTKEHKGKWRCICRPGFCAKDGKCVKA